MGKVDLIRLDIFPIPTNCVNNAQKYFIQIVLRNKNFYLPQQVLIQHLCLNVADKSFWLSGVRGNSRSDQNSRGRRSQQQRS